MHGVARSGTKHLERRISSIVGVGAGCFVLGAFTARAMKRNVPPHEALMATVPSFAERRDLAARTTFAGHGVVPRWS